MSVLEVDAMWLLVTASDCGLARTLVYFQAMRALTSRKDAFKVPPNTLELKALYRRWYSHSPATEAACTVLHGRTSLARISVQYGLGAALHVPLQRLGSGQWAVCTCGSVHARASYKPTPIHPRCRPARASRCMKPHARSFFVSICGSTENRHGTAAPEPAAPCCAMPESETLHLDQPLGG